MALFVRIHRALIPDADAEQRREEVEQDWEEDTTAAANAARKLRAQKGGDAAEQADDEAAAEATLEFPDFHVSLFELVDQWTTSATVPATVDFMQKLFQCITKKSSAGVPTLRDEGDVLDASELARLAAEKERQRMERAVEDEAARQAAFARTRGSPSPTGSMQRTQSSRKRRPQSAPLRRQPSQPMVDEDARDDVYVLAIPRYAPRLSRRGC